MRAKPYYGGFSLVEVLIAVMLVGLAIAALMAANTALTNANGAGTDLSTAEFLIGEISELTALLPVSDSDGDNPPIPGVTPFGPDGETLVNYDDLDDFNGSVFSPPINSERTTLTECAGFSQQITVQNVSASDFELVVGNHTSDFVRVTVRVFLNSRLISSESWLRARY